MALNDDATLVVAQGFIYINSVGALAPTPTDVDTLDPNTFGAEVQLIEVSGTPTGGSFTIKAAVSDTPATVPYNATLDQLQAAIEGLASIGLGNTSITGTSLSSGFSVALIGEKIGTTVTYTIVDTGLTGGTTPHATATVTTSPNGWLNVGHTSREELPEFGFDGGKYKVRGTWQKKRLRDVQSADIQEDSLMFALEQWDKGALELYFGEDAASTAGVFGVDGNFKPVEKSVFVVLIDGDARVGFYASKAQITRDKSTKMPLDDFASLPVKATFLNLGTRRLYDWISLDLLGSA